MTAPRPSAHAPADSTAAQIRRRLGRARGLLIGALILVVCLGASAFAATEWHSSLRAADRRSFTTTAGDLGSALAPKLEADVALARTLRAIATMEPGAGETRFLQWYRQLQFGGAPISSDLTAGLIVPVAAARLPAFRREVEADPAYRALTGGKFQIVPAGRRAVYCLARAVVNGSFVSSVYPTLLDYCAPVLPVLGRSPFTALMRTATNTDSAVIVPVGGISGLSLTGIAVAVYRNGAPLATSAERRAAVTGFIATTFNGVALLESALVGHRSMSMTLYHTNAGGSPELIAEAGAGPQRRSGSYVVRSVLGDGWVLETTGIISSAPADAQSLAVFGFGALITLLVVMLYMVLLRSRQQAWGLVAEKTEELSYLALHDALTGLPNRSLVLDRAQQMLARGRRLELPVTAVFMDIDGFKQINELYGHRLGDEILRQVAERLQSVLRDGDTVGRLGADEFVMLVDPADRGAAERVADRIGHTLDEPIDAPELATAPVSLTASIGVVTGLPDAAEDLLRDADLAMSAAKAIGKGGHVVFESAMHTAAQDRIELELGLGEALEADQFSLVYQPILEIATQRVVGAEALLRWTHPTRGETPPDVFIPIAEASGLIIPIGHWVLEQACMQCAAWHRKGQMLGVSVNVSARQFERAEFVDEVRSALAASGLDAMWLTLEITETALMRRPSATEHLLVDLKTLGVQIAVDDFGTGYSSLGYLRQFPIDSLKLDRSFITGLARSNEANALVHTLIQLGKTLGLQTVAEGVEAYTQLRHLQGEGCELAQGFLFARPLTPDALDAYLGHASGAGNGFTPGQPQTAGRT